MARWLVIGTAVAGLHGHSGPFRPDLIDHAAHPRARPGRFVRSAAIGDGDLEQQPGGLLLDEDPRFEKREWRFERVGWLALAVIAAAALAGFFGNGPLSHASVSGPNLEVGYQRYARNQGATSLEVAVAPAAFAGGEAEVWLSGAVMRSYEVDRVRPQPATTRNRDGGVAYVFETTDEESALEATFTLRPDDIGRQRGAVAAGRGRPVEFAQFVYP